MIAGTGIQSSHCVVEHDLEKEEVLLTPVDGLCFIDGEQVCYVPSFMAVSQLAAPFRCTARPHSLTAPRSNLEKTTYSASTTQPKSAPPNVISIENQ